MRQLICRSRAFTCITVFSMLAVISGLLNPVEAQSARPRPASTSTTRGANYFPLAVGNKWVYTVKGVTGASTRTVEVLAAQPGPYGEFMYQLSGYFGETPAWVIVSPSGRVTQIQDGQEYLWYELGGVVGRSWKIETPSQIDCVTGATFAIGARDEKISVPAGEFSRVVRVENVKPVCMDAGVVADYFAPGVGLVQRTETTFAGPLIWELTFAELGSSTLPAGRYTTALHLSSPVYVNNLMPPIAPESLPWVRGAFSIRNGAGAPAELVFTGCQRLSLEVRNEKGELVLATSSHDGCCECDSLVKVDLAKESFALAFSFRLADQQGAPLPDGFYTITAILETVGSEHLRPAAKAKIEVKSTH